MRGALVGGYKQGAIKCDYKRGCLSEHHPLLASDRRTAVIGRLAERTTKRDSEPNVFEHLMGRMMDESGVWKGWPMVAADGEVCLQLVVTGLRITSGVYDLIIRI